MMAAPRDDVQELARGSDNYRPRLLDLFCGAGGVALGFAWAGFEVVGVDVEPQPNYPFEFHLADALTYPLEGFDTFHASAPCQLFSSLTRLGKGAGDGAPDLIGTIRERLEATGRPYVMENVVGAPLKNPTVLCGSMFGLGVGERQLRRHRLFETNFPLLRPRCNHRGPTIGVYGDHPQVSKGMNRAHTLAEAQEAMGIDWMTWPELREAIPPAYTECIGGQLIQQLKAVA